MRTDHWEIKLDQYLDEKFDTPFEWGTHDCALFAANWIELLTGVDVAGEYRGKYDSELGAYKLIRKVTGGSTPADCMTRACTEFDFIEEHPSVLYAQRGDIVSLEQDDRVSLGIVELDGHHAWFTGDTLTRYPLHECKRSWHIG
jgi:hypothetical protein